MKRVIVKIGKIAYITAVFLFALVVLLPAVVNVVKFAVYPEYYSVKEDLCFNPGLNDGFVCQGVCANEPTDQFLLSGYMMDDSASRIYVTDLDNRVYYVSLLRNGAPFDGHCGGLTLQGDTVYLATNQRIFPIPLSQILQAKNGDSVEIGEGIKVNNKASFCFADDQYLYVGEYNDGGAYKTEHAYQTPDGLNHAIISRYSYQDLTKPDRIYSIRDCVQGFCVTAGGSFILATSYGITDSHYYVYNEADVIDSGETFDGAPVYYLGACQRDISGPAMTEGLDIYRGKVVSINESASNKYIFGKFFFANRIITLDLQ